MKLCIPVAEYRGPDSVVFGHFGSAPMFVMVGSETSTVEPLVNQDVGHEHGACNPLRAMAGRQVDALIVGGIGAGAVRGLRAAGIVVGSAPGQTLPEAIAQIKAGPFAPIYIHGTNGGHAHGGGCH